MKPGISWDDARIFLAVAEAGSFSAAATALMIGQPTISRRIASLEEQLGASLFHRGRRGTTITQQGSKLLPAVKKMARASAELEAALAADEASVSGVVSIAAPPGVAYDVLVPLAATVRDRLPGITLDILADIEYLDLTRGMADIAMRSTPASEPALVTIERVEVPVAAQASREYASHIPHDARPEDLDWICWSDSLQHITPYPQLEALIPGFEPAFRSNDFMTQVRACELGMGVMWLPWIVHETMHPRDLARVHVEGLPSVHSETFIVCAKSMQHVPRVRAVLDALLDEIWAWRIPSSS